MVGSFFGARGSLDHRRASAVSSAALGDQGVNCLFAVLTASAISSGRLTSSRWMPSPA